MNLFIHSVSLALDPSVIPNFAFYPCRRTIPSQMASTQLKEQDLAGKVAVITGASRGIGRAVAMNLAARGCSILGTCSSSESVPLISSQLNDEVLALYTSASHTRTSQVLGLGISIYSKDCAKTIANSIEKYFSGRVDILVSNAADANPGILGNLTVEEIEKSLLANVQTPVLIVDELVKRRLFQPDSRIIYVSSIRTRQPWSMQLMYSAGKSAGESLCRSWAEAFGGKEEKVRILKCSLGFSQLAQASQISTILNI